MKPEMSVFEYKLMTNDWEGAMGAGYNQCFEFCQEFGWIDSLGVLTKKGHKAIEEYKK